RRGSGRSNQPPSPPASPAGAGPLGGQRHPGGGPRGRGGHPGPRGRRRPRPRPPPRPHPRGAPPTRAGRRGPRPPPRPRGAGAGWALGRIRHLGGVEGTATFRNKKGFHTVSFERGTIQSVSGSDVVIKSPDGTTWTWKIVSDTVVRKNGAKTTTSALAAGEKAF